MNASMLGIVPGKPLAQYLGQCDRVRRASAENERRWHTMMTVKERVPVSTFLSYVDFSPLLEDGETAKSYIADAAKQDSTTATYRSVWGGKWCWFLQTAGFEFIFVE